MSRPPCDQCGSLGKKHRYGCPVTFRRKAALKVLAGSSVNVAAVPLTIEQYGDVREAMIVRPHFSFASFSLSHRMPPREVKAARDSDHYEHYLKIR